MKAILRVSFWVAFTALSAATAQAQTAILDYAEETPQARESGWSGFVAAGTGILPEFDGAADYQVIPMVAGQVNKGNYYIATRGLGLVANVIDSPHFNAGPVLRFRFGRDDDIDNARLARLDAIDDAFEAGGFISAVSRDNMKRGDNFEVALSLTQDVAGGHDGMIGELSANYMVPLSRDFRLGLSADLTYQDDDYTDAYFSISPMESARTGLQSYNAQGGLNSAGLGVQGIYSFNQRWGLFTMLQYDRLLADAADNPIVEQEGSPNQMLGVVALTYRF